MKILRRVVLLSVIANGGIVLGVETEPVMLTDFSVCTPRSALATKPEFRHWQMIEYQADGVSGKMLGAKGLIEAPDVTLPMKIKGWHKIYIAYWNPLFEFGIPREMVLKLKLTGDPCFQRILQGEVGEPAEQTHPGRTSLVEVFWRAEDLTDKNLSIGKFKGRRAYIAYVKLVPLSPEEVAGVKQERESWTGDRRLVGTIDGTAFQKYFYSVPTEEDLREWVEVYRYSTVGKIIWAVNYGDWVNYPSKFGKLLTDIPTYGDMSDNIYSQTIVPAQRALLAKGIAYHDIIADHLHSMGIKFDIMIRPSIQRGPLEDVGGWMDEHPEFRMRHGDGSPIEKLSYAFPEVRNFQLAIIREAAERFDIDGVNVAFVRLNQTFGDGEQPLVDAVRAKYGEGPWTKDQMNKVKEEFLIQLMRDARKVLDEVGKKKGKRLELSALVWSWAGPGRAYSPIFNVDYRTMMKEKLLDSVIIHQGAGVNDEDIAIAHANGCKYVLYPDAREADLAKILIDGYAKGLDGAADWDINDPRFVGPDYNRNYKYIRSSGDPEKLNTVLAAPPPDEAEKKFITIHKINGKSVSGKDLWNACYAGG